MERDAGEVACEPVRGGCHERTVERRAHRKELRPRLPGRSERNEACDRCGMAGDDDLPAAVQVGRHDDVPLRRLRAEGRDGVRVEPDDRRHRAFTGRHGFLHEPPALADADHGVAQVERAGRDQRGPLAEAVPATATGASAIISASTR
jgi:hypothetical protein